MRLPMRWAAAVGTAATLAASVAGAQEVRFAGFTNGCFGPGCTPATASNFETIESTTGPALRFLNSTFDETTARGFAGFGGTPQTTSQNFNNFGSLVIDPSLTGNGTSFTEAFSLRISFTDPSSLETVIGGSVTGSVSSQGNGGISLRFDNNGPITLNFANGRTAMLNLNNASLNPSATQGGVRAVSITGDIMTNVNVVPEPSTYMLLGTGIAALGLVARRRRTND